MYFEGVERPSVLYTIRDGGTVSRDSFELLERYFHDLHTLFLKKLAVFTSFENKEGDEDALKLQALLQELVKVRGLIEKGGYDRGNKGNI